MSEVGNYANALAMNSCDALGYVRTEKQPPWWRCVALRPTHRMAELPPQLFGDMVAPLSSHTCMEPKATRSVKSLSGGCSTQSTRESRDCHLRGYEHTAAIDGGLLSQECWCGCEREERDEEG